MRTIKLLGLVSYCFLIVIPSLHALDKDSMLAKARAYLGDEADLKAVKSLRYVGVAYGSDGERTSLELILKKPYMQRISQKREDKMIITATNGYEGYTMFLTNDATKQSRLGVLSYDKVQDLIINAMENLYFFEGYKKRGGELRDGGLVDYEGKEAYKLVFSYPNGTEFVRYFDPESGDLFATVHDGVTNVEDEYFEVQGIRFPRKLSSYKDGKLQQRIEFNSIEVNPEVREQIFEFPSLKNAEKVD